MTEEQKKFIDLAFILGEEILKGDHVTRDQFLKDVCAEPGGKWLIECMKAAYNLALEDAANPSYDLTIKRNQDERRLFGGSEYVRVVYQESILKLKIQ